jgi:hypothetical protein
MMVANACTALVLVIALWPSSQRQLAVAWASAILMFTLYHGIKNRRPGAEKPSYVSRRAVVRAARNALLLGGMWATLLVVFFEPVRGRPGHHRMSLRRHAGWRCFRFCQPSGSCDRINCADCCRSAIAIGRSGDQAYLLVALLMISYIAVLLKGVFVHATQIARRVSEQIQAERKVRSDELTDLPNRLAFFEGLESAFARSVRLNEHFAILYLDLDDFKNVNDKLGQVTDDKLPAKAFT